MSPDFDGALTEEEVRREVAEARRVVLPPSEFLSWLHGVASVAITSTALAPASASICRRSR